MQPSDLGLELIYCMMTFLHQSNDMKTLIMQTLYFAISFLGNMAMLMAAYFVAHQRHVGEITVEEDQRSDTDIGAALAFVTISSVLSWICHYAYYSIFGHPWEAFQSNSNTSTLTHNSCHSSNNFPQL